MTMSNRCANRKPLSARTLLFHFGAYWGGGCHMRFNLAQLNESCSRGTVHIAHDVCRELGEETVVSGCFALNERAGECILSSGSSGSWGRRQTC